MPDGRIAVATPLRAVHQIASHRDAATNWQSPVAALYERWPKQWDFGGHRPPLQLGRSLFSIERGTARSTKEDTDGTDASPLFLLSWFIFFLGWGQRTRQMS